MNVLADSVAGIRRIYSTTAGLPGMGQPAVPRNAPGISAHPRVPANPVVTMAVVEAVVVVGSMKSARRETALPPLAAMG